MRHHVAHRFVCTAPLAVFMIAASVAHARTGPSWARLELVENTVEGPAFDRCQIEAALEKGQTTRWRLFYGEARPDSNNGWIALRSSSGCAQAGAETASTMWTLRGSPYLVADVAVGPVTTSGREILIDATISIQKLTGFSPDGVPTFETRTEKRLVRVPEGDSALVPILVASPKEMDEFRARELFLTFRASGAGSKSPVAYGELAVDADMPRAEIFLDGGFVRRTSSRGPVVLGAVRAGERAVIVRDASGREARAVVRVEKGRRASVSLVLLKGTFAAPDGLRPMDRNPQGGEEFWREKDGAVVVRVPGGEFPMGSSETQGEASERPLHVVRVDTFLMDKTEVTWGQYERFLLASSQPPPKSPAWGMPETLPCSSVTWHEASAFCTWVGGRLPTEAEWERAARGDDSRQFPWGDTFDPWRCNTRDGGPHAPTAAAQYPDCVGPYGVLDQSGSVAEWCSDWYQDTYAAGSPAENPTGPSTGTRRVSRGGNWMNSASAVRAAARLGIEPAWPGPMQGFRCVQDDRKADGK